MARLTISRLLCFLRDELLDAREKKDVERLETVSLTLGLIELAVLAEGDSNFVGIMSDLTSASVDALIGEEWKSRIPSAEEIMSKEQ